MKAKCQAGILVGFLKPTNYMDYFDNLIFVFDHFPVKELLIFKQQDSLVFKSYSFVALVEHISITSKASPVSSNQGNVNKVLFKQEKTKKCVRNDQQDDLAGDPGAAKRFKLPIPAKKEKEKEVNSR